MVDPSEYDSCDKFIEQHFGTLHHYNLYKQELNKEIGKFKASRLAQLDDQYEKTSIYMVLESIREKRRIKAYANNECCSTTIVVNNRRHRLKEPPFPDLIIWKNKDKNTKIRVLISWFITIAIIVGSYLLIGLIEYHK